MLAMLSPLEFLVLAVVIVLVFGARRFGRALRSLKVGGRELKRGLRGEDELPSPSDRDGES